MNQNQTPGGDAGSVRRQFSPDANAPDAAQTNRDHPSAAGERAVVPGAGVVDPDADAGPVENRPDRGHNRPFPGQSAPDARLSAPGAERTGSTDSGAGARAARGATGPGLGGEIEASQAGQAPLGVPTGGTGAPTPGSSGTPATSDPNYPANAPQVGVSRERGNDAP